MRRNGWAVAVLLILWQHCHAAAAAAAVPKSMVLSLLYWQPQLTSKAVSCPRNNDTAQRCCGAAAAAGTNIRCGAALTSNHLTAVSAFSLPNSFALLVLIHIFDTTVVNPLYISLCLLQRSYNSYAHTMTN